MVPKDLVLRCFGYRTKRGTWIAKCIDLDLVAEENTFEESRKYLHDAIESYLDTVIETEYRDSIPQLLLRKSPLRDQATYYLTRFLCEFAKFISDARCIFFKESIPFHLAHQS